ncbi:MAG: tetratricopeptide repeat protein, partial [Phycisphaerales bacterium]|nr:tetratricopeptide repeat protein [Phycisphaerales bacterium]
MAARVNTKFVVILAVSLVVLVAGLLGVYLYAMQKNPSVKIEEGMRLLNEGRIVDAAKRFEQAVGRDRTNVPNIELWHDTVLKIVPKNETVNREFYDKHLAILKTLAQLQPGMVERQQAFLSELWNISRLSQSYDSFVTQANEHIAAYQANGGSGTELDRLRRYRGLGNLRRMEVFADMDDDARAQTFEDLTAAYEADPTDWEAGLGLSRWHFAEVNRQRKDGRTREAENAMGDALKAHEAYMAAHPRQPEGLLLGYVFQSDMLLRQAVTPEQVKAAFAQLAPEVNAMITVAEGSSPEDLRTNTFLVIAAREAGRVEDGVKRMRTVMERVAAARPDDIELKMALSLVMQADQDYDAAIALLDEIATAEDRTISTDQLKLPSQRLDALAMQIDASLAKWEAAEDMDAKGAALVQAKGFRDTLKERVTSGFANALTLREAKIAIVEGQYQVAVAKLSELLRSEMGDDPVIHLLMARVLALQGNYGQALEEYRKVPRTSGVLLAMGRLHVQLQDLQTALTVGEEAVAKDPENEEAVVFVQNVRDTINMSAGTGTGSTDGTYVSLLEARKARLKGEYDTARSILNRLRTELPDDPRAWLELVYTEMNADNRDEAKVIIDQAAARFPDNVRVRNVQITVNEPDPVKGQIEVINSDATTTDVQKMVGRYHVYRAAALREKDEAKKDEYAGKAAAELNAAITAAPGDPVVVEVAFVDAIEKNDQRRATELKDQAARNNLDQLDGMLYQSRYDIVFNEDYQSAERILTDALDRIPNNPPAWRLLGQVQRQLGKHSDALESFAKARLGRPDDVAITKEYISQLITMNRPVEALDAVKADTGGALRFAPTDPDLINLWLELESQIGDRRLALTKRLEIYQLNPKNVRNSVALANIYASDNRWDQVEAIADKLAEIGESPMLVASLKTRSLLAQDKPDEAVATYTAFVEQLPADEINEGTWTTLARLLSDAGREDEAEAAYGKARAYQGDDRGVDRLLADHYFAEANQALTNAAIFRDQNAGAQAEEEDARSVVLYQKARDAYKAVVDAGVDTVDEGYRVTKRLVETYLRLDDRANAEKYLARIAPALPDDLEIFMLRASVAQSSGDAEGRRQARAILAEAIGNTRLAGRPEPFMQRVLLNRDEPDMFAAVVQDLDQIHRLDPSNTRAWALRYTLFRQNGKPEEAFTELRRGINMNPANDELRLLLLRELIASNRLDQAAADVLAISEARPDSLEWKARAAGILSKLNRWPEVARFFQDIYDATDDVSAAIALLDAKLRTPERTSVPEVNTLMQRIVRDKDHDSTTVANIMLRGRAYTFLKRPDDAEAEFRRGLEAAGDSAARQQLWLEQLILAKGGPAAAYDYVENLNLNRPGMAYLMVQLVNFKLVQGAENLSELQDQLASVDQLTQDPLTLRELYRVRSRIYYQMGEYSPCVEWLTKAVDLAPADVELRNNLAYLLANEMQDPQAALVHAERAAQLTPLNSTVLDTLGWTYAKLDRNEEAVRALVKAVNTAAGEEESLIANVHLGM